ncbi:hypothetical protein ACFWWC_41700 [Streptomyces sp. NPDC058642]|uniref:hypothetical protein n=1 Tax=Streptomyces sp. NPDC058642 TaxID=3346572 RepID=UPI00366A4595
MRGPAARPGCRTTDAYADGIAAILDDLPLALGAAALMARGFPAADLKEELVANLVGAHRSHGGRHGSSAGAG